MKVVFLFADKEREEVLADAFLAGVAADGHEVEKVQKTSLREGVPDGDVFCMVGVKSLKMFRRVEDAGKQILFFDKGYFRHRGPNRTWEYWRIAVNSHHPTDYIAKATHGSTRWEKISRRRGALIRPWRENGNHILIAGSSEKYHSFCNLESPTDYARKLIKAIGRLSERPICYRPKPTWKEAVPIKGARFSPATESFQSAASGAWAVVTHGSNAGFDAILTGIPSIVLGNGIARPVSSTSLEEVENPYLATDAERSQWLANIAWCMFTEEEMAGGLAWEAIKPQLFGKTFDDSRLDPNEVVIGEAKKASKAILKKAGLWDKDRGKRITEVDLRRSERKQGREKKKTKDSQTSTTEP